uniref:Uncharacterized protein n=1 Tax=Rhizophora mucronata TaxID=61149 RepID=A0A2P2QWP6_RHIMU
MHIVFFFSWVLFSCFCVYWNLMIFNVCGCACEMCMACECSHDLLCETIVNLK